MAIWLHRNRACSVTKTSRITLIAAGAIALLALALFSWRGSPVSSPGVAPGAGAGKGSTNGSTPVGVRSLRLGLNIAADSALHAAALK